MPATRLLLACGAALAVLITGPAAASAATYCVKKPTCVPTGGGFATNSLQDALYAAEDSSDEAERIELGADTFAAPAEGFLYSGGSDGAPVTIVGAGRGRTVLKGPDSSLYKATTLSVFPPASTISDLDIEVPVSGDDELLRKGIETSATVERVNIRPLGDADYTDFVGLDLDGGTARDVAVEGPRTSEGYTPRYTFGAVLTGTSTLDGFAARGVYTGVRGDRNQGALRHLNIQAAGLGVDMESSYPAATVTSSLIRAPWAVGSYDVTVNVVNSTLVGDGSDYGSVARGISNGINHRAVNLDSSIVRGYSALATQESTKPEPVLVNVTHSMLDRPYASGRATTVDQSTSVADPLFADAASGDYRLKAGSPAIDAGNPMPFGAAPEPLDLAGVKRPLDGDGNGTVLPDIGAYEFSPAVSPGPGPTDPQPGPSNPNPSNPNPQTPSNVPPGSSGPVAPSATSPKADTIAPAIGTAALTASRFRVASGRTATSSAAVPRGTTIRLALSEAATVSLRVERATKGRRRGKRCSARAKKGRACTGYKTAGTLTRRLKAGAAAVPFTGRIGSKALRPGRYRLTVTAGDAAGNRSKPRVLFFTVVR